MQNPATALEALINSPQVMIWMTDENHLCNYVNQAVIDYCGFNMEKMTGLQWQDIVYPEDREAVRLNQIQARKHHHNFRQEYRVQRPDGEIRWAVDTGVPRFDSRGKFLGYIGTVIDITEQKRTEEDLKTKKDRLEKEIVGISDREQRRIGQDLHDGLSQQLLALGLQCSLVESELRDAGFKNSAKIGRIRRGIQKAMKHSRGIARALNPVNLSHGGLPAALRELRDFLRENFGVGFQYPSRFSLTMPDPDACTHLYRILQEATTNAIRHGKARNISLKMKKEQHFFQLTIVDDGVGPPQKLNGRGMGLATMKYRAELLGGRLEFSRKKPRGAEVRLFFPIQRGLENE